MKKKKLRWGMIFVYLFIGIFGIITVFPFIYMILGGLMSYQETTTIPPTLIPKTLRWSNYQKGFIQLIFLSLLMVPGEAIIFTNYNTIAHLGLLNTYLGLVLPFLTSIFYMYYLQSYFTAISPTIYKAAMIDGASDWEYIWKILVPMSKGGLITVALLSFISGWNSFLWPLLVTNEDKMRLLNNGLAAFASDAGAQTQLQLAAATLTVVPVLIVYFIFRKQIIRGVVRNDLKA